MQGVFPPMTYSEYGLPGDWYGALEWQYPPHQRQGSYEEEGRAVNTLKVREAVFDLLPGLLLTCSGMLGRPG